MVNLLIISSDVFFCRVHGIMLLFANMSHRIVENAIVWFFAFFHRCFVFWFYSMHLGISVSISCSISLYDVHFCRTIDHLPTPIFVHFTQTHTHMCLTYGLLPLPRQCCVCVTIHSVPSRSTSFIFGSLCILFSIVPAELSAATILFRNRKLDYNNIECFCSSLQSCVCVVQPHGQK